MPDVIVIPSAAVEALRRKAKKLRKEQGVPHHAALDAVARAGGRFPDWHHLIEAAKATEPAEEAFKHGLVIGMDIKDALQMPAAKLTHFIEDERLQYFVFDDFDLHPTGGLGVDEDLRIDSVYQTVFYRSRRIVPASLEEAFKLCRADFFFAPRYVRLGGIVMFDVVVGEEGEEDEDGKGGRDE